MCDKNTDDLTSRDPESDQKEEKKANNLGSIKVIMIVLFILTLCCLHFALLSMHLVNQLNPQHGFNFTKNSWVAWCWLPIPIISIILGFKYVKAGVKCKKNIIGGFIIAFLLLMYGSFSLDPAFGQDYSKIDMYRSCIDAELPDSGQLEIVEWGKLFDDDKTDYVVINAYYDREDVGALERSITSSTNWIPCDSIRSELKVLIPSTLTPDHDAYYSIYNKTTGEYNALPATAGSYEIYSMKYDKSEKHLEIHRFLIEYRT